SSLPLLCDSPVTLMSDMNSTETDVPGSPNRIGDTDGGAASPPLPRPPVNVFFGPDGLRAIWGIGIFLALVEVLRYCVVPVVGTLVASSSGSSGLIPPSQVLAYTAAVLVCVLLATWIMAKIEGRPIAPYGFRPQRAVRNFCAGLAWGVALLSLLIVVLRATGLLVFDARLLFGGSIVRYGFTWLAGFLLVGLLEELMSRAYLQFTLARGLSGIFRRLFGAAHANGLGFWTAALILSFAFGLGHQSNPGESPLGLLSAGLAGLLFCLSLWRTGSLWWAIGFHTSWDWAQSFLYGVPDSGLMIQGHLYATHAVGRPYLSGGLTGPEGSLFLMPVILVGAGIVLLTLPRTSSGYEPASAPQPSLH
ncbi:MAG TPA: type II CAAX endopeptidase family protein, partial [Acidobacteriaceae bacterium]